MLILSRIDDSFQKLCQPKIDVTQDVEVTEDSIKVNWDPSLLEEIFKQYSKLKVESYDLMIHPAEQRTVTIKKAESGKQMNYVFENLKGKCE